MNSMSTTIVRVDRLRLNNRIRAIYIQYLDSLLLSSQFIGIDKKKQTLSTHFELQMTITNKRKRYGTTRCACCNARQNFGRFK